MKQLYKNIQQLFSALLLLFIATLTLSAAQLANDQFTNGLDGYTGSGVSFYSPNGGWMVIDKDAKAKKTYNLGINYANKDITINYRLWANNKWDYSDQFEVFVNGIKVANYRINHGGTIIRSITATTDANGNITLAFKPNTNRSDEYGAVDYVILSSGPSLYSNNPRPFTKRFINGNEHTNIPGDLIVIGNQSLCWKNGSSTCKNPGYNASNNNYYQQFINYDTEAQTNGYLNATSADLQLSTTDHIIDAKLYIIGRINDNSLSLRSSADTVYLKTPTTSGYVKLKAPEDKFNWMVDGSIFDYGAVFDVTQYVQEAGTYWVADLKATEMYNQGSGWALVIVVEGSNRSMKNISIFDGFNGVFSAGNYPPTVSSTITGFLTPKQGTVKSNLVFFAGESDRSLSDSMKITKEDGTVVLLKDSLNDSQNILNGTITENGVNVTTRTPNYENTLGIDIDNIDLSNIIQNNQTSTTITVDSFGDRIFLSMYGFATELYVPKLCYDYTVQQNNFDITDSNRTIRTTGGGELSINLALQSQEGDFDFEHSKLSVELIPATDTSFKDAYYSPNNVNTYVPAIYATEHTSTRPMIALGEYVTSAGGRIKALQRYFAQFNYDLSTTHYEGRFEVDLNTTINFGSGPVPIYKSTRDGTLTRCPQTNGYNPRYGSFNVERHNSGDSKTAPEIKYPLYTQIVGKDFDFDVVAYQKDPAQDFHQELALNDYTVAVELINARHFQDENATFLCNNPNPAIIQNLDASGTKEVFARFQNSSRVDMSTLNISVDTALRSAAFRIWYIVDGNNTIVPYTCTDPNDNSCFQNVYDTYIKPNDTTLQASGTHGFCSVETIGGNGCSDYVNQNTGARGCYACLRDFFSKAVCSRDNFSIRPVSYRLGINDNNESTDSTHPEKSLGINDTTDRLQIAAGYLYKLDGNATAYLDYPYAKGYKQTFFPPSNNDLASYLRFETSGTCYDINDSDRGIHFENGKIAAMVEGTSIQFTNNNLFKFSNAGDYSLHIKDNEWTLVDQARYPYKTFPDRDDCIANQTLIAPTSIDMSGCEIRSDIGIVDNGKTYRDLRLHYHPYSYDLSNVKLKIQPEGSHLFMSDFDEDSYYQNAANLNNVMAALYVGDVTAKGKDDNNLTNYTDTCAATDVRLQIKRDTNASEDQLFAQYNIRMQQYLIYGDDPLKTTFDDKKLGKDANITLAKAAFPDSIHQGSAHIRLYTTFKKPIKSDLPPGEEGVPPIKVNYLEINATGDNAQSKADMETHTPTGKQPFDRNVTFYYARVVPTQTFYQTEQNSIATPLNVMVYSPYSPEVSRILFDLNSSSDIAALSSNWYYASGLFANNTDIGTTDLELTHYSGHNTPGFIEVSGTVPPAQTIDDMTYELSGKQPDLTTSIQPGGARPVTYEIKYTSVPWLEYDIDTQKFRVRFIPKPTAWTGYGKTGHVVGNSSDKSDDIKVNKSKRIEW